MKFEKTPVFYKFSTKPNFIGVINELMLLKFHCCCT